MTEIQQWEAPAPVARHSAAITRLVDWAQEADAAFTLAQRLTSTAFCPEQFRGKPADAAAAMLAGGELGFSPLTALNAFDVIQGRAAAKAITLRALVQSKGHEIVMVESTETRCRMKGRRLNSSEWQAVTWTIDRAKGLGLTGKHNWKAQPGAMLIARATSEISRLVASDAILGLAGGYSSEEIADGGTPAQEVQAQSLDSTPATTRRMSRPSREPAEATFSETPEGPVADVTDEPQDAEEVADDAPSDAATRAMFASFRDAGFTDDARSEKGRARRLEYIGNVIGREVASSKEMTAHEVSRVIDALKADAADLEQPEQTLMDTE